MLLRHTINIDKSGRELQTLDVREIQIGLP